MTGEVVAVKVQRPDVLESVTLDLYVIRLILLFVAKNDSTRESALSILGVIDNWADRFLQELDYLQEAANGDRLDLALGWLFFCLVLCGWWLLLSVVLLLWLLLLHLLLLVLALVFGVGARWWGSFNPART